MGVLIFMCGQAGFVWAQNAEDPLIRQLDLLITDFIDGAVPLISPHERYLERDESHHATLSVEAGRCYTFAAVGEATFSDIDLHVYGRGVQVAADTDVDARPVAHWCSHDFQDVSVEIRAYSGFGRVLFQWFVSEGPPEAYQDTIWAAMNALSAEYATGFRPAAAPVAGVLRTSGQDQYSLEFAGGREYVVVAAVSSTVTDLDLELANDEGEVIQHDRRENAEAVLRFELPDDGGGVYQLTVTMTAGYGPYGIRVYSD